MRRVVTVNMPERPDVAKFVLIERPGITYVNSACKVANGIVQIIAPAPVQPQAAAPPLPSAKP